MSRRRHPSAREGRRRRLAVLALIGVLAGTSGFAAVASAAESIEAGPIWSDFDAKGKCPAARVSHNRNWIGNWKTTVPGRMSQCECARWVVGRMKADGHLLLQTIAGARERASAADRAAGWGRQTPAHSSDNFGLTNVPQSD